ncbi:MAG: hypothetical protein QG597_3212 [Actinomycetota bacterium]|nr:hypothetical protein [Actinomycetota bacterium]
MTEPSQIGTSLLAAIWIGRGGEIRHRLQAPLTWTYGEHHSFGLLQAPGPRPPERVALQDWLLRGCPDPAPERNAFVLAHLDSQRDHLRVVVGARPGTSAVVSSSDDQLIVGTSLPQVMGIRQAPITLDTEVLADLVVDFDDGVRTPFVGVHRIRPGHLLEAGLGSPGGPRRWFRPEEVTPLTPAQARDSDTLMRDAVASAVAESLPATGDVGACVSGGLDSTMVAACAARRLHPDGRVLHGFSHAPLPGTPDPSPHRDASDEPFARLMAETTPGLDLEIVVNHSRTLPMDLLPDVFERSWQPPLFVDNLPWIYHINELAVSRGLSVLLTGQTGNATFSASPARVPATLLRCGNLLDGVRAFRNGVHQAGAADTLRGLGLGMSQPVRAWVTQRAAERRAQASIKGSLGVWDAMSIEGRREAVGQAHRKLRTAPQSRGRIRDFMLASRTTSMIMESSSAGIWWADPLGDQEVVRLAMSLPLSEWNRGGIPRSVARRAGRGLIPEEIRRRARRGGQAVDIPLLRRERIGDYCLALDRVAASPVTSGFIDTESLQRLRDGLASNRGDSPLLTTTLDRAITIGLYAIWLTETKATPTGSP